MEEKKSIATIDEKTTLSFISENRYYIEFRLNKNWIDKNKDKLDYSCEAIYNLANFNKNGGIEWEEKVYLSELNKDGKVALYFDDEVAYTKFWVNAKWFAKQTIEYPNWYAEDLWYKAINDIENSDMDFEVLEWF